jgi:hypothetical protein
VSPDLPHPPGRVTRRSLMITALSAAALPLGISTPPPAAIGSDRTADDAYQKLFLGVVANDPNIRRHLEPGREFLYRPRQLLVAHADTQRVVTRLRQYGYPVTPSGGFAGVTRLRFDREADVPTLVRRLREPDGWPGQSVPRVQPHHVLVGFGNIMGNPGGPPQPAAALPAPDPTRAHEGAGVTVGVCDTGIWASAADFHPLWLGGSYLPEPDDVDPLYVTGTLLGAQGGHGTFVSGLIRQAAPGVRFDPEAALDHNGIGDEESLVAALGRLDPEVEIINLSLGGYTLDDVPPLPLATALAARPQQVVVAAAGNSGTTRPSWPAALDSVVAVAAVSVVGEAVVPADYSGYGSWVDACALGARTSTYVTGQLALPGLPTRVFDGFAAWAGTSFAAAHVTGRLAAMMTAGGLSAPAARAALLSGAVWQPGYGVLVG